MRCAQEARGAIGVAADVKLLVAVQPAVNQVSRQLLGIGKFACGIGDDETDPHLAQVGEKFRDEKARMPDFDCVTEWLARIGP